MDWFQQLIDFILHIDSHLLEMVNKYGVYIYILLFLILFCETGFIVTPFLPGDSLLFAAGALVSSGNMNLIILFLICIAGAILGNQLNFTIGKFIGPKIFERESRFIKKEYLFKTQLFYEKHGGKALIIGRYLPFIRTFVPFVAGIGQMNVYKYTLYNIIGAVTWIIPVVSCGFLFGNIPFVKNNFSIIILSILVISVLPMIIGIISAWINSYKTK